MKSIDFKERNSKIGFQQEEFQGIYARKENVQDIPGAIEYAMCFKLDEAELKQVQETGCIWIKRLQPASHDFHPIGPDVLMPEGFEAPNAQNIDEVKGSEDFNAETFDITKVDLSKVNYFFKKQAAKYLKLELVGKSEEAFTNALLAAQKAALASTSNPGF